MGPLELLPYRDFGCLRLAHFIPPDQALRHPVVLLENWEFMGGVWHGHASGFSEFLYHQDRPDELGAIALDAEALPSSTFPAVLAAIGLPLATGMSSASIEAVLGKPRRTLAFTADRVTHEYSLGASEPYRVHLTVEHEGGLSYVVVIREDVLAICDTDA